ncbi:hypothetical protein [Streptomyces sp. NPDC088557]|uniref:hypothetical protein n=1 Tax=Streptomyces sp. NPDC088557 TaxID=3365867 RepID=UPI003826181D
MTPPRLRTLAIPAMLALTSVVLAAGHAHAEPVDPVGIGDLLPSPQSGIPAGQGTLYETYGNPNLWMLDSDYGRFDVLDPMAESIADICMALIAVIGTAVVTVVQWLFQLTSIPEVETALTKAIGGAAEGLSTTLLPAAMAVGALIAFAKHREGGGGLSQIAWLAVSGVVSLSLLSTPQVWVDGVDTTRQVGANIALNATAGGITAGPQEHPFKLGHEPRYTGTGRDDMVRKSSDAIWRSYVATPWCLAEFGSLEVCERHGKDLLDQGVSKEARKEWLQDNVTSETVGRDSEQWRQGHTPMGRIAVTVPSLVVLIIFAVLVLTLAFASLASLIGALMLLVAGTVFASLWVIPGRPRQWGLRWFDQLLALTLQSFIATMTLGCVLIVQVVTSQSLGSLQWAPAAGLSIAAAMMAFKFRKILESIIGVSGSGASPFGAVLGMLAARSATRALRRSTPAKKRTNSGGAGAGGSSDGGGGGGGDEGGGTPHGGGGVGAGRPRFRQAPRVQPSIDPPQGQDSSAVGQIARPGAPSSLPDESTRPAPAPVPAGPLPLRMPAQTAGVDHTAKTTPPVPAPEAAAPSPSTSTTTSFRQAPAPDAPGPRAIEARMVQSTSARATDTGSTQPRHQPRVTQAPPPARRTADSRRPQDSRPGPRPGATSTSRRAVPVQRES